MILIQKRISQSRFLIHDKSSPHAAFTPVKYHDLFENGAWDMAQARILD